MSIKERITVTIDPEILARLDQIAEARGESRSTVFERAARAGLESEEEFLQMMGGPIAGELMERLMKSPRLYQAIATAVGQELESDKMREVVEKASDYRQSGKQYMRGAKSRIKKTEQ